MYKTIDALKSEISSHGMVPPEHFEPGKIERFSDGNGKNKNGYCVLYVNPDGSAGAAIGNWKDINQTWFYTPVMRTYHPARPYSSSFCEHVNYRALILSSAFRKNCSVRKISSPLLWVL